MPEQYALVLAQMEKNITYKHLHKHKGTRGEDNERTHKEKKTRKGLHADK
jgi:hypothetical protein